MKNGDLERLFADDPELLALMKDVNGSVEDENQANGLNNSILQESEDFVTASESDFEKSEEVESLEHEESTQSRSIFSKVMNVIFNLLFYSIIIAQIGRASCRERV